MPLSELPHDVVDVAQVDLGGIALDEWFQIDGVAIHGELTGPDDVRRYEIVVRGVTNEVGRDLRVLLGIAEDVDHDLGSRRCLELWREFLKNRRVLVALGGQVERYPVEALRGCARGGRGRRADASSASGRDERKGRQQPCDARARVHVSPSVEKPWRPHRNRNLHPHDALVLWRLMADSTRSNPSHPPGARRGVTMLGVPARLAVAQGPYLLLAA